jgi:hypothetical protein
VQRLTAGAIGMAVVTLVLGVVVGTLGTVMHRSIQPWGVVICLVLAFAAAITARAWGGLVALAGYAIGLFVSVQVLAQKGPGGDTLVPDGQAIGWVWVLGSIVVTILVGVLPRGLFDDRPRPRAAGPELAGASSPVLEGSASPTFGGSASPTFDGSATPTFEGPAVPRREGDGSDATP